MNRPRLNPTPAHAPSARQLEQRLREEAPTGPALPRAFHAELARRLDDLDALERADPPRRAWLLPTAGLAAAAALALGAFLTTSWPIGRPGASRRPALDTARIARALGEGVQSALGARDVPDAIEARQDPLSLEASRLLADARQLADRFAAPFLHAETRATPDAAPDATP